MSLSHIDWMLTGFVAAGVLIALSLWSVQRRKDVQFDLLDLLMENGRVSKTAVAFMLVLGVSNWMMMYLLLKDRMTEGYFTIWVSAWIAPLVLRVVFGKTEAPGTTITRLTESSTTVVKDPLP